MDLNKLRDQAYKIACGHGFHDKELSNEHWLCLVISELMEAVEADSKGRRADKFGFDTAIANAYNGEVRDDWFFYAFNRCIKDSVEDELSDAVIRLLDLAGLRKINIEELTEEEIEDLSESCNDETFTESVYAISIMPVKYEYEYNYSLDKQLNSMLLAILGLAKHLGIDLLWHIEQKMKYNQSREKMHGKKY